MSTPNEPQNPYGSGEPQPPQDPSRAAAVPAPRRPPPYGPAAAAVPGRRVRPAVPRCSRHAAVPGRQPRTAPPPAATRSRGPGYGAAYPKNSLARLVAGARHRVVRALAAACFTGIPAVIVGNNAKKAVARGEANNGGMAHGRRHPRLDRHRAVGPRRSSCSRSCSRTRTSGTRFSDGYSDRATDVATVDDGPQARRPARAPSDAPAPDGAGRRASLTAPLVAGGGRRVATVLLARAGPARDRAATACCPLSRSPGCACPACGGLRATHDLAHGDLAGAWAMNPLWVLAGPGRRRAVGAVACASRRAAAGRGRHPRWAAWVARRRGRRVRRAAQRPGAGALAGAVTAPTGAGGTRPSDAACGRGHSGTALRWLAGPTATIDGVQRGPEPTGGEGEFSMTVLDDIVAGVRQDLAVREAGDAAGARSRSAPRRRPRRIECVGRLRAEDAVARDRRGQALEPEQGRARHDRRPGRARGRVRDGRRGRHLRAHRASAGSTARSPTSTPCAPRSTSRCCARTSSSRRTRCGRRAPTAPTSCCSSSRRSSRPCSTSLVERVHSLGHDRPGRGARRRGGRRGRSTPAPACIGVNARDLKTLEVDRTTFARRRPARSRRASSRSPSPASAARTTSWTTPAPAPTPCSSARPRHRTTPRASRVADLVAAGAHPSLRAVRQ